MTSNGTKGVSGGRANQPNFVPLSGANPSILLDKLNVRRSTPDSEALASSDEENDLHRQDSHTSPAPTHRPTRRASWLNDTSQGVAPPRKGSFASSSMSPTTSHPSTPSGEPGAWVSTMPQQPPVSGISRQHSSTASLSWGAGIWNNDSRNNPPSRLTEVLPSPTSTYPPGSNSGSFFNAENTGSPNASSAKEQSHNATIPFPIPLHPTPKTYRSQSYSVGQLDPDASATGAAQNVQVSPLGRGRMLPHTGLQHRPSRPSMLSEMTSDSTGLSKLKEIDGDDVEVGDGSSESMHGGLLQSSEAKTIEILARENAILRHQQYHNSRIRPRSSTASSSTGYSMAHGYNGMNDPLLEESDYAIDELDEIAELHDNPDKEATARRLNEYGTGRDPSGPPYTSIENRNLENVKRAYWQSSLGFGGLSDIPQSRRHSFADIPTRQASVGSIGEPFSPVQDMSAEESMVQEFKTRFEGGGSGFPVNEHATAYFGNAVIGRHNESLNPTYKPPYQQYGVNTSQRGAGLPTSPHGATYGMSQPRQNQLLYIVLFKCSRADVFYVQEGTGLSVKPGDLVIVEADRGTDLGTVAQEHVDWTQAKDLKEHYAEEHYKWLMMYSQGAAGNSDGTGAGLMAASNGLQGSAIGGMGPPNQLGIQEANTGEIKPKIIKRLAQNHEIQALRDKEGNEAKAKRVCMQRVKEHGLHMEILDAEFQMDWKKLTFYYFADAYINFNSLVTDLFKVYKTRIWMSAINPASFASPSLGLQAPSGIGPGAIGASRNTQNDRRQQSRDLSMYAGQPKSPNAYVGNYSTPLAPGSDRAANFPSYQSAHLSYGFSPYAAIPRNAPAPAGAYTPNIGHQMESFQGYASNADFSQGATRYQTSHSTGLSGEAHEHARRDGGKSPSGEPWMSSFQSLSLNSR